TGQPKGVQVIHNSLVNLSQAQINIYGVNSTSRIFQFVSLSFDVAGSDISMALCSGAALCLPPRDFILSGTNLTGMMNDLSITHIQLPVSVLQTVPYTEIPSLQSIIIGGDVCPPDIVSKWSKGRRIFNAYGPTETTITATIAECKVDDRMPPIGKPIANALIYILDEHLRPTPIGVPGELFIGGAGMSRGYLNYPALTEKKFIPSPFSHMSDDKPGLETLLYKTGDMARYLSDGNIEFIGRLDDQVKIRGFRIELGEIETVLSGHPKVKEAALSTREDRPGDKRLVAYIVPQKEDASITDELRQYLKDKLPAYMAPSAFVMMQEFPLLPNGKIDRKKLPKPERGDWKLDEAYVKPKSEAERLIAEVWQEELQMPEVGIHNNFFDLGGNSLLMVG
ncbi:MAG: AMP-binding protein, partial [Planctomycetes bacterium]|nr:AMP-binding protein [Planctomycetota bacterium]